MLVTYRFKLRLTAGQHARLAELYEIQRHLYNAALEERIGAWNKPAHPDRRATENATSDGGARCARFKETASGRQPKRVLSVLFDQAEAPEVGAYVP